MLCSGRRRPAPAPHARGKTLRISIPLLMLSLLGAIAGCQNAPVAALEDQAAAKTEPATHGAIGTGSVVIGMLASPGDRDRVDGASLAVRELGPDQVTLVVHTAGTPAETQSALAKLGERGARLVIGRSADDAQAFAAMESASAVPFIALDEAAVRGQEGAYGFGWDEISSAAEGAAYAVGAGRKRILAIVPTDMAAAELERLRAALTAKGASLDVVRFSSGSRGELEGAAEAIGEADAIMFLSDLDTPPLALSLIRAGGAMQEGTMILGTATWPTRYYAEPVVAGTMLCMLDRGGIATVAERFRAAHGRAISSDATYAYDAAALATGLVRSGGADAITRAQLTSPSGFRGALGPFRFREDGSVERNCSIYRINNRELELVDPAPAAF